MHAITSQPHFITPEEHAALTSSTPASFTDIPPVLRHVEEHVEVELDPAMPEIGASSAAERLTGKLWVTEE
jgi:nucleotide-sensitive chloride channel 1A